MSNRFVHVKEGVLQFQSRFIKDYLVSAYKSLIAPLFFFFLTHISSFGVALFAPML
jgi:hypothetical protein